MPTEIPTYDAMLIPTVRALQALGGSGSIAEIYQKVAELLCLPSSVLDVPHVNSSTTEVEYRLAWSRTYLKKYGLVTNSPGGIWSLTAAAADPAPLDPKDIVRAVRASTRAQRKETQDSGALDAADAQGRSWHDELRDVLLSLSPVAFEHLIQRLLRESGFIQVEVTGRSGDGGIDGTGIAQINGVLSFHVLFQCKRYQGAVSPSQIRDFRGAMQGRTDKGLFITTGTFTRDAVKEATRDGAPPIDLINGEQLVLRLKDLGLGVQIRMVESVEVDRDWFSHI